MSLLLDTHAIVWWLLGDQRLSARARDAILASEELWLSAASAWELATKARLGKWPEAGALVNDLPALLKEQQIRALPVSLMHGRRAGMLGGEHRDPFDRMPIAQCLMEGLTIVSVDAVFDDYGVARIG